VQLNAKIVVLALLGSGQNCKFIRKFIENRNKKPNIQNFRACGGQKKPLASLAAVTVS